MKTTLKGYNVWIYDFILKRGITLEVFSLGYINIYFAIKEVFLRPYSDIFTHTGYTYGSQGYGTFTYTAIPYKL